MTMPFTMSPLWAIVPNQIDKVFKMEYSRMEFFTNNPGFDTKKKEVEGVQVTTTGANFSALTGFGSDNDILQNIPATFSIENGVAILPIEGMVIPKSDMFTLFFGGFAALDILTRDFLNLVGRSDVHTIVLDIDSPGGSAFGVQQFANLIFDSRNEKPIIAVTSGMMASAAMWIGAAAHKVFITGDVTVTGSIGTVTSHVDISEAERMMGVKTTEVAAGEFKRLPSMHEPLTTKGRLVLQDQVNHANAAFINDIAKFKNVIPSTVISKMAEGKTFIGTQGIRVGLIDDLKTMETILNSVTDSDRSVQFISKKSNFNSLKGGNGMTITEQIAQLKNDSKDLYDAVFKLGVGEGKEMRDKELPDALKVEHAKGVEEGKLEGKNEGAIAERERINGIREFATAGNKDLIEGLVADGATTPEQAAVQILKAQKEAGAKGLESLEGNSPAALDADIVEDNTAATDRPMSVLVQEYMTEHKCSKGEAIKVCARLHPNAKNDFIGRAKKEQ